VLDIQWFVAKSDAMEVDQIRIAEICKSYSINKLCLFGSAARGDDAPGSDVDLLVEFGPYDSPLAQIVDSKNAFEGLFGKRVDLVELKGVRNPFFRKNIEEDQVVLYEA
jgi:predicted nucleotidyltransferase